MARGGRPVTQDRSGQLSLAARFHEPRTDVIKQGKAAQAVNGLPSLSRLPSLAPDSGLPGAAERVTDSGA